MSATSEHIHAQIQRLDECIATRRSDGDFLALEQLESERVQLLKQLQRTQEALHEGKGQQLLKG